MEGKYYLTSSVSDLSGKRNCVFKASSQFFVVMCDLILFLLDLVFDTKNSCSHFDHLVTFFRSTDVEV